MNTTIHWDDSDDLKINARFIWPVYEAGTDARKLKRMYITVGDLDLSLTIDQAEALADTILDAAHTRRAEIAALNDRVSRPQGSAVLDASNG